ncbi:MAG: DUF4860 domain-containing protein [Bilifractor sp.]|jgi:hypothetical protein
MQRFGRQKKKTASVAQIFCVIALFALFMACAILVILFGARVYKSTVEKSNANYSSRTLLSYVTEKIHQNDRAGGVSVGEFDGMPALILEQSDTDNPNDTDNPDDTNNPDDTDDPENTDNSGNTNNSGNPDDMDDAGDTGASYTTYIYLYDGNICELTAAEGAKIQADAGTPILEAEEFVPEDLGNGLFRFTCVDTKGEKSETYVTVRSEDGEAVAEEASP